MENIPRHRENMHTSHKKAPGQVVDSNQGLLVVWQQEAEVLIATPLC